MRGLEISDRRTFRARRKPKTRGESSTQEDPDERDRRREDAAELRYPRRCGIKPAGLTGSPSTSAIPRSLEPGLQRPLSSQLLDLIAFPLVAALLRGMVLPMHDRRRQIRFTLT